jgi:hypothetical protein
MALGNPNIAEAGRDTRFQPGECRNPGGRPKGLAKRIRELTDDGETLIQQALTVLRDGDARLRDRAEARHWLTDHGFGKAVVTQEINLSATMTDWIRELAPFLDPTKKDELARYLSNIEVEYGRS